MRQLLGEKKLNKYRNILGKDIVYGLVRGGTNHRVDLYERDNGFIYLYKEKGKYYIYNEENDEIKELE